MKYFTALSYIIFISLFGYYEHIISGYRTRNMELKKITGECLEVLNKETEYIKKLTIGSVWSD